jgi:integrase
MLTGARLGELLGLQWRQINFDAQTLEIRQALWEGELVTPKTEGSVRLIYFGPSLLAALEVQKQNSNHKSVEDFVFRKEDGSPLNPDVPRRDVLYPALDSLGIARTRRQRGFTPSATLPQPSSTRNWEPEARTEAARALQPEHDGRRVYAHIRRRGSKRRARLRAGDFRRSVPSCSTFWNMEQRHGSKLK